LEYVRKTLNHSDVIIEQFIPGKEYRLYVVDGQVVGAMNRVPANITGDGEHSIKQLIDLKNEERGQNPRLVSCPIIVNQEVENYIGRQGYTYETVPKQNEVIFLSEKTNISTGGDPIDVFDDMDPTVKEAAVEALYAVPGLSHGAVDLIIHSESKKVYILELNPTANLGGLLYPIKGQARDIPKAIIDYYFPETVNLDTAHVNSYFDYHDVLEPLQSRDSYTTTVTPCPQETLFAKKYTVSGDVMDIGYHRGLRKHAFERLLHGYIMTLEEGAIEIVVGGTNPEMVDDFKNAIWEDEERAIVFEVEAEDYYEPIKVGFEIKTDLKTQIEELELYKQELEQTELTLKKAEIERRKLHSSLSWRATAPIRFVGSIRKKFKN
jgi:acylphosphatase